MASGSWFVIRRDGFFVPSIYDEPKRGLVAIRQALESGDRIYCNCVLCVDVDADGTVDEFNLAAVEGMVHDEAGNSDDGCYSIELREGEQAVEAAEDIGPYADAEVQSDEVRR